MRRFKIDLISSTETEVYVLGRFSIFVTTSTGTTKIVDARAVAYNNKFNDFIETVSARTDTRGSVDSLHFYLQIIRRRLGNENVVAMVTRLLQTFLNTISVTLLLHFISLWSILQSTLTTSCRVTCWRSETNGFYTTM